MELSDEMGDIPAKWQKSGEARSPGNEAIFISSSAPQGDLTPPPVVELPKTQKKRGRKKKGANDDMAVTPHFDAQVVVADEESKEMKTQPKKKRGRPRKSAIQPPPEAVTYETNTFQESGEVKRDGHDDPPEEPMLDDDEGELFREDTHATPTSKMSKSKKGNKGKKADIAVGEVNVDASPSVLGESDRNMLGSQQPKEHTASVNGAVKSLEDAKENQSQSKEASEVPAKPVPSSTSASSQSGKVPLRVGLSKRSRIAPLLKIVRK